MAQRRSLEPVQEEYLESEADTPQGFAPMPAKEKPPSSHHNTRSPKVSKSQEKRGSGMLSQTQPVNLKGTNSSYNTITQPSSSTQNLAQTQLVNPQRVPSATRAS